jgi:hypothetical protein
MLTYYIALVSGASSTSALQPMKTMIEHGLSDVYENACKLSLALKRDLVSVRVEVAVGSDDTLGQDARETLWAEMGEQPGDRILGNYAFGLVKTGEHQAKVVLHRPQVATEALLRHVQQHGGSGSVSG